MAHYTIDRFETTWAVLEDEQRGTLQIPKTWLPSGARENDVLAVWVERGEPTTSVVRVELDPAGRQERLAEAQRAREALPRGPKGDVSL